MVPWRKRQDAIFRHNVTEYLDNQLAERENRRITLANNRNYLDEWRRKTEWKRQYEERLQARRADKLKRMLMRYPELSKYYDTYEKIEKQYGEEESNYYWREWRWKYPEKFNKMTWDEFYNARLNDDRELAAIVAERTRLLNERLQRAERARLRVPDAQGRYPAHT
jgi:hypothetical protein